MQINMSKRRFTIKSRHTVTFVTRIWTTGERRFMCYTPSDMVLCCHELCQVLNRLAVAPFAIIPSSTGAEREELRV